MSIPLRVFENFKQNDACKAFTLLERCRHPIKKAIIIIIIVLLLLLAVICLSDT